MGLNKAARAASPYPRSLRIQRQIYIARETLLRIEELARQRGIRFSHVIDEAMKIDYRVIWSLFVEQRSHAEVVLATGLDPQIVRELHAQFRAGYGPVVSLPSLVVEKTRLKAARERRIAAEAASEAKIAAAGARAASSAHKAHVRVAEIQKEKHLGSLAATNEILERHGKRA
jgi:hypothetical protein